MSEQRTEQRPQAIAEGAAESIGPDMTSLADIAADGPTCRRCGHPLRAPKSVRRMLGPVCATRDAAPSASWDELVEASTQAGAAYYSLGRQHGYREGYEAAQQDAQLRATAAQIARAGVEAIDIMQARRKADERAQSLAEAHRAGVGR